MTLGLTPLQQPVTQDLRELLSNMKISYELERIMDYVEQGAKKPKV